jgi:23S rRNA pseudouridine2605 synthase
MPTSERGAETERLQKVLAHAGVASRRAAEQLIEAGRVRVNGLVVDALGARVDPHRDRIEVDGARIAPADTANHYVMLNKPTGVVTTVHDPRGRPTVLDLVRSPHRLYPVGRLDIDSEGLVLLTDDGELTFRLTQARFGVPKEYHALAGCGHLDHARLDRLRRGVELDDGPARALEARVLWATPAGVWVSLVLAEGRNRQVRRMLAAVGCSVLRLRRVRIGPLVLGHLAPGAHRPLRPAEVAALRRVAGLPTA